LNPIEVMRATVALPGQAKRDLARSGGARTAPGAAPRRAWASTATAGGDGRSLSLPLRLAGVYGLLIAATLLVVAGVTVAIARSHLQHALDVQLAGTAQSFRQGPASHAHSTAELEAQTRRWLGEHPLPTGEMAAIRISGGRVLTSAGGLDLFEIHEPPLLLTAARVRWWTLDGSEGAVRGLTVPILGDGRQRGTLVLLAYEKPTAATLAALLTGIGIASAIGLGLALLIGALVVHRNLRPLSRMATEVAGIEATGDLSRRVSRGERHDELGRLANGFDRMLARLEEAFRAQRRFLADASHELRTPLTVARGQLELLTDELDATNRRSLAVATDELDRMARIVDDLLLLARLDEGTELRREPVEVELVLREALLRAMLVAPRNLSIAAEPDLFVLADPDRLLQVLTNLITNAVQHTDRDGRIVLASERRNGTVLLRVSDNGPGIPAAEQPHVFERFYRGGEAGGVAPDGSGLGLAIAASIITAMRGKIHLRSAPGHGATFTIDLPAVDSHRP
jgi:signal transduction histidine kinase